MRYLITTISMLIVIGPFTSAAWATDSLSAGIRIGSAVSRHSTSTELFGDLHLNRLVSIGATFGYTMVDKDDRRTFVRDESIPITALFKLYAPISYVKPYAGLGQALIFHDKRGTKGSVIGLAGVSLPLHPLFLNIEYRRQFDDQLNFIAGGLGVSF